MASFRFHLGGVGRVAPQEIASFPLSLFLSLSLYARFIARSTRARASARFLRGRDPAMSHFNFTTFILIYVSYALGSSIVPNSSFAENNIPSDTIPSSRLAPPPPPLARYDDACDYARFVSDDERDSRPLSENSPKIVGKWTCNAITCPLSQ